MRRPVEPFEIGRAAGGDDDDLRRFAQHGVGLGEGIEPDIDGEPLDLLLAPVDEADEILAPARAGRHQDLAAELARRLEQHNLVAALAGNARRFEPGRPAADDDDLAPRPSGTGDQVRQGFLTPARRVVQAGRPVLGLAVRRAHAGADCALLPRLQLGDDIGIGDVRPRHRDHVEQTLANGVACARRVGDARGVEHRQIDFALERPDRLEPGRNRRRHAGHVVHHQRHLGVHPAIDRVEEVDAAAALEDPGDGHALLGG